MIKGAAVVFHVVGVATAATDPPPGRNDGDTFTGEARPCLLLTF